MLHFCMAHESSFEKYFILIVFLRAVSENLARQKHFWQH